MSKYLLKIHFNAYFPYIMTFFQNTKDNTTPTRQRRIDTKAAMHYAGHAGLAPSHAGQGGQRLTGNGNAKHGLSHCKRP